MNVAPMLVLHIDKYKNEQRLDQFYRLNFLLLAWIYAIRQNIGPCLCQREQSTYARLTSCIDDIHLDAIGSLQTTNRGFGLELGVTYGSSKLYL